MEESVKAADLKMLNQEQLSCVMPWQGCSLKRDSQLQDMACKVMPTSCPDPSDIKLLLGISMNYDLRTVMSMPPPADCHTARAFLQFYVDMS